MKKVSFKRNKRTCLLLSVALIIITAIAAFGLFKEPISAHAASTTDLFVARTTNTDLTGSNYSVTSTPAITVLTHGLGGNASHWSNNVGTFAYDNRKLTVLLLFWSCA